MLRIHVFMFGNMSGDKNNFQCFTKSLRKVELHAHLNGSLSQITLQKLIQLKKKECNDSVQNLEIPKLASNDLSECFQVFDLIHKITDSPEAIYMATCDVIEDFYKDGVAYLELRTTPKEIEHVMTQEMYVATVLKAIEDTCSQSCEGMHVKLLLSIDRKRPLKIAEEMMKIAEKYYVMSSAVVGIDFSGDPKSGNVSSFIPLLEYAKKIGLKLAVHISEVPEKYHEIEQLLNLHPDRLGHGTYLHPQKQGCTKNFELVQRLRIPLEICLTSNIISQTVPSYEEHHYQLFKEMNYPCIICTDDKGIFNTTLSNEYYLASHYFSLSKEDLYNLSYDSINYTFATPNVKQDLKESWEKSYKNLPF